MSDSLYPPSSAETAEHRRSLAPEAEKAFQAFSRQVFADGALPAKVKQIIAVAVAAPDGITRIEPHGSAPTKQGGFCIRQPHRLT